MGILFGTDGIRGVAGEQPLDRDTIYRIGHCLTKYLGGLSKQPHILLARDTRISGPWIEAILMRAIEEAGGCPENCGVIPTPAVSHLTIQLGTQAGIVVSASHNPYQDNGIKVFSSTGMKFTDAVEDSLEEDIRTRKVSIPSDLPEFDPSGVLPPDGSAPHYRDLYTQILRQSLPSDFRLNGIPLVVDCAHGSLSAIAPAFLSSLGADVRAIHCRPDGRNINLNSGALHLEKLKQEVLKSGAVLGIAFDGDADRTMLVDKTGATRDGDDMLYLLARYSPIEEAPRTVVGTVMANLGLEIVLAETGFQLVRTAVGDRYVLEEMLKLGAVIGGEQSGHVILKRYAHTGDGLLTALKVLQVLREQQKDIDELCRPVKRFPQVLRNIRVKEKIPFSEIAGLNEAEADCRARLGPRSRILLRYSGTEKLARVMVEGEDAHAVDQAAHQLASVIEARN
jgi:phosphoglucosamine mutase